MLPFHPDAVGELEAAIEFLERERPGYGGQLADEVRRRLTQAERFPQSAPRVRFVDPAFDARPFTLRRFRYVVVVANGPHGTRWVYAIAHTSREPGYWLERLP